MTFAQTPVLENAWVRLEPLSRSHSDHLAVAVSIGDLWKTWYASIPTPEGMAAEIDRRLGLQAEGRMAPWAVVSRASGRAVGMTTYMNIDAPNRRVEIGSTWLGRDAQRTGLNPAAKLLLLTRAFDDLGCIAVEFRTHWHNAQSRAAIARLGAKQDGVLRNHQVWRDGTLRDTVVFSIIDGEWPAVRQGLSARLAATAAPGA
ncbi:GNAT family N-acetyltransferase [Demequina lutea]|uniref:RimJ/RimL family protein N-acetyltransferase n=1 Tax=Demequina lutea TaxID=431489 RepID=A0A7Y9Z8I4_9MICO|nr:GNAT family protein [Demequina lutea]NYI40744.1 RimJ/RimL family protein N-acetyltransferase [Demequina lutea]